MTQPGRTLGSGLLIFWPKIVQKSGQRCQKKWKLFHKISGDPNYSWPNYWGRNLVYKQTRSVTNLKKTISQSKSVRPILSFIFGPSGHPKLYLKRFFYFKKNVCVAKMTSHFLNTPSKIILLYLRINLLWKRWLILFCYIWN